MQISIARNLPIKTLTAALLSVSLLPAVAQPKQVLVVSVTKGFRHDVIPTVDRLMGELAQKSGKFTVDYVRTDQDMANKMTPEALQNVAAVVFNNTTGDLPLPNRDGFLAWIKAGGGFVGFHAATDTFPGFPGYIDMIGGQFQTHHEQVEVEALNEDPKHPATRDLPASFRVKDEIYLVKNFFRNKVHGLLWLDKHPNYGMPGDYPIAWCKAYGAGRVFYTSLGHRVDVVKRPDIQQHYLGGILWALGLEPGDATPPSFRAVLSPSEVSDGFRPLFNGEDLAGWHYRNPDGRKSWSAQHGLVVNRVGEEHGTDLVSDETFQDFTVRYEYLVPKNSNSGFYLRGRYELQIVGDYGRTDPDAGSNGAIYSVKAPSQMVSRPSDQWQEAEVTIKGNRITAVLNGVQIHNNVEVPRPTGGELDSNLDQPGPILLQGDHGNVAFRNIRIKPLK